MGASPEDKVEGRTEMGEPATAGGSQVRQQRALPPTWLICCKRWPRQVLESPSGIFKNKKHDSLLLLSYSNLIFYLTEHFYSVCSVLSTFINLDYNKIILVAIIVRVPATEAQRGQVVCLKPPSQKENSQYFNSELPSALEF